MTPPKLSLVEFPADDADRARRFWEGLLGEELVLREPLQGEGWHSRAAPAIGIHRRGRGPGDSFSLPYFSVEDVAAAAAAVEELGGTIIHPGARWTICKDSEGNPFALAGEPQAH